MSSASQSLNCYCVTLWTHWFCQIQSHQTMYMKPFNYLSVQPLQVLVIVSLSNKLVELHSYSFYNSYTLTFYSCTYTVPISVSTFLPTLGYKLLV